MNQRLHDAPALEQAPPGRADGRVSIVVIVDNPQHDLDACLNTLSFSDDIVIIAADNANLLKTPRPALRLIQHDPFENQQEQTDFVFRQIQYKHAWVFICHVDERVPDELAREISTITGQFEPSKRAFAVRRRTRFLGRWIRHADNAHWQVRLLQPGHSGGPVGTLRHRLLNDTFAAGLLPVLYLQNEQSTHQAGALIRRDRGVHINYFLALSAIARFLKYYLWKGGVLDGMAGMHYCWLLAMYGYWVELKIREHQSDWRGQINALARKLLDVGLPVESEHPKTADGHPLVEVMIPTLNEREHIQEAIASCIKLGPVFVLDSFSQDGTQELARAAGATVVEHKFVHYAAQKNWGLDNLPFQGDWIFILDADERITPLLHKEIAQTCARSSEACGYYVNRALLLLGANIRHGGLYPSWNLRLFRRGKARYEDRAVHEHVICSGATDYLSNEMLHVRRETMTYYLEKHIKYADMESEEWIKRQLGQNVNASSKDLFKSMLRFRQWIRRKVWPRLPARPLFRFVYMYFVRLGLLDGRAGWHVAELMACYEYMISLLYKDKLQRFHARHTQAANFPASTPKQ